MALSIRQLMVKNALMKNQERTADSVIINSNVTKASNIKEDLCQEAEQRHKLFNQRLAFDQVCFCAKALTNTLAPVAK